MRPLSKILIIDPDSGSRFSLAGILAGGGRYAVSECADGQEAKAMLARESFDIVALDDRVPGRWVDVVRWIQQSTQGTGLVVLAAALPPVPPSGSVRILQKPVCPKALELAVACLAATCRAASPIIGESPAFRDALEAAGRASRAICPVLILGETGTGKEVLANQIHNLSRRSAKPMIAVNSGGIPASLIESTLFGYVKGAFTGAVKDTKGVFESAEGGTLFLDEIGDMPPEVQVKLLRVLETRRVQKVGNATEIDVDVRIIAATHRDLLAEVAAGRFRADLYYRIAVSVIRLPPLRERASDLDLLVGQVLGNRRGELDQPIDAVVPEAMAKLRAHTWPGNIRELDNVIRRALLHANPPAILPDDILFDAVPASVDPLELPWKDLEREYFRALIERHPNQKTAAQAAGIEPSTLSEKLEKLGLRRTKSKPLL